MDQFSEEPQFTPFPQELQYTPYENHPDVRELSPDEKTDIDEQLDIFIGTSVYGNEPDTHKNALALRKILRHGNKSLPYLKERMFDNPDIENDQTKYQYCLMVNVLAEPEDADLIVEMIKKPSVYEDMDGASLSLLSNTMTKLAVTLRNADQSEAKLHEIAQQLIEVATTFPRTDTRIPLARAIAATGDSLANEYINGDSTRLPESFRYILGRFVTDHHLILTNMLTNSDWQHELEAARAEDENPLPSLSEIILSDEAEEENTELTPEEKEVVENSLRGYVSLHGSYTLRNESCIPILSLGNRVLPFLKEQLIDNRFPGLEYESDFLFSKFAGALAEVEDMDIIKASLLVPRVHQNSDGSTTNKLLEVLNRLITDIRHDNPDDPRLEQIARNLLPIRSRIGNGYARLSFDSTVAYAESASSERPMVGRRDTFFDRSLLERAGIDIPQDEEGIQLRLSALRGERDYAEIRHTQPIREDLEEEIEMSEEAKKMIALTESMYGKYNELVKIPESCEGFVIMHIFNTLHERPEATELDIMKSLGKLENIIYREKRAQSDKDLPTIGIEVEVPKKFFPLTENYSQEEISPKHHIARELLTNHRLKVKEDGDVNEFVFHPSYSASTQNALLFELRKAGFIPTDNSFASLHINLGKEVPDEKVRRTDVYSWYPARGEESKNKPLALAMSDLLTYAFVPDGRIRSRNYENSVHSDMGDKLESQEENNHYLRYEFRTAKIFGAKTYRLLSEVQLIGTLLTSSDTKYEALRSEFMKDINLLRENYDMIENGPEVSKIVTADKVKAAWQLRREELVSEEAEAAKYESSDAKKRVLAEMRKQREPNLIDDSRHLMWNYAHELQRLRTTGMVVEEEENYYQNSTMAAD